MSNDAQFLVRAASFYNHETALANQTEMFIYIWNALSQEEKDEALEIWQSNNSNAGKTESAPPPSNTVSKIPQGGIDLIKEFEGYETKLPDGRAQAYPDPIHGWGVPTIGYGTTKYPNGNKVKQGDIITQAQAEEYLTWEVEQLCKPNLEKIPTWNQMNDNQKGAIYSFAYNLGSRFYGAPNFQSITKLCNSPNKWNDPAWVEAQFVKYCNPGSSAEAGLRRRRKAEAALFCTPV